MRILFISNYYPPCRYAWGYQQLCEEVADGLHARGHSIAVLTGICKDSAKNAHPYPVHEVLTIEPDWHSKKPAAWQFFFGRGRRERELLASLQEQVARYQPDVLFFWHTGGLPRSLLVRAEQLPNVQVVYYLADYLPEFEDEYAAYWKSRPVHWSARLFKRPMALLALRMLAREDRHRLPKYEHCICVSDYVRRRLVMQNLIPESAVVVHNGVDLNIFNSEKRQARLALPGLRCLVAGRVSPEKGIHTVVEALGALRAADALSGVTLTVLGSGPQDYVAHLREQVALQHLEEIVEFRAPIPREQMPEVLAQHDVLILASEHAEPLARAIQEAMAMGLLVIGTTTGGSGELLVHEKTGLVFEPGDAQSLATQLMRAAKDPRLVSQLAEAGRKAVEQHFDIRRTIEQIERLLLDVLERKRSAAKD